MTRQKLEAIFVTSVLICASLHQQNRVDFKWLQYTTTSCLKHNYVHTAQCQVNI